MAAFKSEIFTVSFAPIWVIFQNSVTYTTVTSLLKYIKILYSLLYTASLKIITALLEWLTALLEYLDLVYFQINANLLKYTRPVSGKLRTHTPAIEKYSKRTVKGTSTLLNFLLQIHVTSLSSNFPQGMPFPKHTQTCAHAHKTKPLVTLNNHAFSVNQQWGTTQVL